MPSLEDYTPYSESSEPCTACSFSSGECPVMGWGPIEASAIKLIVISEYPGPYEVAAKYPFWSNEELRQPKRLKKVNQFKLLGHKNAGNLIRSELKTTLGLCSYTQVFTTNALRCQRKADAPTEVHVKTCVNTWLHKELSLVHDLIPPTTPFLCLGSQAWLALKLLDSSLKAREINRISLARMAKDLTFWGHPVVVSANPSTLCKTIPRVESMPVPYYIPAVKELSPLPGSPLYLFRQDLLRVKQFLDLP